VDLATLQEREQDDDTIKFIKGPKGEAIVRAANVDRLVERLTSSTYSGTNYDQLSAYEPASAIDSKRGTNTMTLRCVVP
jgi:hypothetical protein